MQIQKHIEENKLDTMLQLIKKHLKEDGICSFGISLVEDVRTVDGVEYKLHQSVYPAEWWKEKFISNGLEIFKGGRNDENHFGYIFNSKVRDHGNTSCYFVCTHS